MPSKYELNSDVAATDLAGKQLIINDMAEPPTIQLANFHALKVPKDFIEFLKDQSFGAEAQRALVNFWYEICLHLAENQIYDQKNFEDFNNILVKVNALYLLYAHADTKEDFQHVLLLLHKTKNVLDFLKDPEGVYYDLISEVIEYKGELGLNFFLNTFQKLDDEYFANFVELVQIIQNEESVKLKFLQCNTQTDFDQLEEELLSRSEFELADDYDLPEEDDLNSISSADSEVATISKATPQMNLNLFPPSVTQSTASDKNETEPPAKRQRQE